MTCESHGVCGCFSAGGGAGKRVACAELAGGGAGHADGPHAHGGAPTACTQPARMQDRDVFATKSCMYLLRPAFSLHHG